VEAMVVYILSNRYQVQSIMYATRCELAWCSINTNATISTQPLIERAWLLERRAWKSNILC